MATRGRAETTVALKGSPAVSESEDLDLDDALAAVPDGKLARVDAAVGRTLAAAEEFESVRVDVRVSLPCLPDPASVDDAYQRAASTAWRKLATMEERARKTFGGR